MQLILLLSLLAAEPQSLEAYVLHVHDGDTCTVYCNDKIVKIRLHGIDSPELRQPGGRGAAHELRRLIAGQTVQLVHRNKHSRDRLVGRVLLDGEDVGRIMSSSGWARQEPRFDRSIEYWQAELDARESRRGLWADDGAVPPWEWRKSR